MVLPYTEGRASAGWRGNFSARSAFFCLVFFSTLIFCRSGTIPARLPDLDLPIFFPHLTLLHPPPPPTCVAAHGRTSALHLLLPTKVASCKTIDHRSRPYHSIAATSSLTRLVTDTPASPAPRHSPISHPLQLANSQITPLCRVKAPEPARLIASRPSVRPGADSTSARPVRASSITYHDHSF